MNEVLNSEAKLYLRRIINEAFRLVIAKDEPDLVEIHAQRIRDLARAALAVSEPSSNYVQVLVEETKELP